MSLNRRQLLLGAIAGAAVLGSPHLSLAGVSPTQRAALLKRQWEAARKSGRRLLVLVIPDDQDWQRGRRLGVWLNNASDPDLAPLAKVEVACATLGELAAHVPGVDEAEGAWMVLVDVRQPTPTWRSIVVPSAEGIHAQSYEDFAEAFVKSHGHKPDWGEINDAYQKHQQTLAKAHLGAELIAFRHSIGRVFASEGLTGGDHASLAEHARAALVKKAPAGSHWASSWGCGTHIEPNPGEDAMLLNGLGVRCGMGHVEAYEARFLHFWATG